MRRSLSRLELIQKFVERVEAPSGLSLNIGCKETTIGDIKLDIAGHPDVKGSALFLPFETNCFSVAIFTEVLEHLPRGRELQALREIRRVLQPQGVLFLSTPSSEGRWGKLYWLADPAFWLIDHRHYDEAKIRRFLSGNGFSIEVLTKRGGFRELVFGLLTPLLFIFKKLGFSCNPNLESDYSFDTSTKGYDLVVQARKPSATNNSVRLKPFTE